MGGLVAFEAARALERRGRSPAALVLLDTYVLSRAPRVRDEPDVLAYARDVVWELDPEAGAALRAAIDRAPNDATRVLVDALRIDERELGERVRLHATLWRASRAYVPGEAPRTPIHFVSPDPERALGTWSGISLASTTRVSGDHHSMLRPPHADAVAAAVRRIVRA